MSDEENEIKKIIRDQVEIEFGELDSILKTHDIPVEISKIIWDYNKVACNKCKACCEICQLYCYYECLRGNRNICCKYEYDRETERYNKPVDKPKENV